MIDVSFAVQGTRLFNCLPIEMRIFFGSNGSFKVRLEKFMNKILDEPCTPNYQISYHHMHFPSGRPIRLAKKRKKTHRTQEVPEPTGMADGS